MDHATTLVLIFGIVAVCVTTLCIFSLVYREKEQPEATPTETALVSMAMALADQQAILVNALVTPVDDQIARIEAENTDEKRRPIAQGKTRFTPPSGYLPDMMGDPEDIPRE